MLPDDTFQITGGPFCEGGYLWWQVTLNNGTAGWAAEGDLDHYYYEPVNAAPTDPNAPALQSAAYQPEALAPGAYYLEVSAPEIDEENDYGRRHLMIVESVNITLKFSQDTAIAWVTRSEHGRACGGCPGDLLQQQL